MISDWDDYLDNHCKISEFTTIGIEEVSHAFEYAREKYGAEVEALKVKLAAAEKESDKFAERADKYLFELKKRREDAGVPRYSATDRL